MKKNTDFEKYKYPTKFNLGDALECDNPKCSFNFFEDALDEHGFVEIIGFGKIHISNFKFKNKRSGIELISEERDVQINKLHFSPEKDDNLNKGQLLNLAMYCILSNNDYTPKDTWSVDYLKAIHRKPRIEQLTIAGALIAAEIDRRLRLRSGLTENEEKELIKFDAMRIDSNQNMTQEEFERWHELRIKKFGEY